MRLLRNLSMVLLLIPAVTLGAGSAMYRYLNEQGDPVYSYTLPSGQAAQGYQKIDPQTGQVLEDVAPALPPEELAAKLRRDEAIRQCEDELERIYRLYSSEADIEHAQQDTLRSLDTRIGQLQANLRQAQREQERLRSQAADAERAGRDVPQNLLDSIRRGRGQIDTLRSEIDQRQREQLEAQARYSHERERFRDGTCPAPGTLADSSAAPEG